MITTAALAAYAILVGVVAPPLVARARWAHRVPGLAVFVWQALMATFVMASAVAVYHLVLAEQHVHDGLVGLLSLCGLPADAATDAGAPTTGDLLLLATPAAVLLLPAYWFVRCSWQASRVRRRQLDVLAVVGKPAAGYDATIVDHGVPAVYCLPGRCHRVVVTRGALEVLSDAQLRAVLAHERAHIDGRHHVLHALVTAFGRTFPGLPLARHAHEQTVLLLEMIADDRALRSHSPDALAEAMCEVAAGQVPSATLGAGGPHALVRLHRVLTPQPRPHRAAWLGVLMTTVAAPLLPLLVAC